MQPAPIEASLFATSEYRTPSPSSSQEHGLSNKPESASDQPLAQEDGREPSYPSNEADAASVASSDTRRGRKVDAGRISSRTNSSQDGSPGSRIEAYEKANSTKSKTSGPVEFHVVPSGKTTSTGASIDGFPNGKISCLLVDLN